MGEPGLADPGLAEDGEELGAALANRALEGLAKLGQLAVAADQWSVESPQERRSARHQLAQSPGLRAAVAELDRLTRDRLADERVGSSRR